MPAEPLTAHEREEIRAGIERGESDSDIARRLGRHRSTIGREVARNGGRDAYTATAAHTRAEAQRARPKTPLLAADPALAAHVEARLKAKDSPMTISIELARGTHGVTANVSHEAIYQGVYAHGTRGLPAGLHVGLHRRRRCRKHRVFGPKAPAKSPLGLFNPIGLRPPQAAQRSEPGHFEGDLILGSFNRSAIVTLFDRASRMCLLADLPEDHTARSVLAALVETFDRSVCQHKLTLTWDRGVEMAEWDHLESLVGISVGPLSVFFLRRTHRGNGPPTRTGTACCAATSARAPTSACTRQLTFERSRLGSTPCPAAPSTGTPPRTSTLAAAR